MQGELWILKVCEGILEHVHGMGRRIREVYIPKLDISFNVVDGKINCFKSYKGRYAKAALISSNFEVPDDVVNCVRKFIEAEEELGATKRWFEGISGGMDSI